MIEKSPKANLLYNKSSHSRVRLDSSNQGVDIEDPCHMESSHDVSRSGMEVEYGEGMRGNFTSAPKALSKRNLGVKSSKSYNIDMIQLGSRRIIGDMCNNFLDTSTNVMCKIEIRIAKNIGF